MVNEYLFHFNHFNQSIISSHFYSSHLSIYDIGDDNSFFYVFGSRHLNTISNPIEAWRKGKFLLAIFKGAHAVSYKPTNDKYLANSIQLSKVYLNDTNVTPFGEFDATPLNAFEGVASCPDDRGGGISDTSLIDLAVNNEDVRKVLLQVGHGVNWINLHSILDTLEFYSKNKGCHDRVLDNVDVTKKDIGAFTGAVNNFGLLSIEARHGEQGYKMPSYTLTLQESQELVLKLCLSYFQVVYDL